MYFLAFMITFSLAGFATAASPTWSTYQPGTFSSVDIRINEEIGEGSAATISLPVPLFPREEKKGPQWGGHFACHDANFTGACHYYVEKRGACHEYEKENWEKYTSIGPDKGQWCYFYEGEQCLGDHVELRHPGSRNLRRKRFDNRVKSWNCWKDE
ncbi:uncharacterized protein EI97DRAFT_161086 [Westerdykella ornata]|uniref:Uncharacterized protein n=1 Tax=Westerdykella ornata TaxID=318751 RepID=A0A6A6JDQ5_WESOR|nr:uncharacterized protein EI97DRAFT_161086 [Westerdykella ornata]KAF2273319.1 hypothetical protein EI97DRAFT_161086 [Westerdykella ornata]